MRVFDMIVDERHRAADLLAGLTPEQWRQPTLCDAWTVHEIGAHLISYLRFGRTKLYLGLATTLADLDLINLRLTRREARRSPDRIVELLRAGARSRISIPRSGFDPVLTDLVLHDLDIRRPLGIARPIPEDRLWVAFGHLTASPSPGFTMGARLAGLRIEAADTGWAHGSGALVRGDAEAVVLAVSGRAVAFDELEGDGVAVLRDRVLFRGTARPARRLMTIANVLLHPPPPERRSLEATGP
ncbi:maleylpyruvate isomerase family mycothiol-dependent enzyme [Longispora sp. K20-0274]|uniref:maleylpyruvate isomerase family mycothiol-dependent enzyme n=1 Tax=Longispora sp. K20-0274 TaxID=3088255 RepID=UPI00399BFF02